MKYLLFFILLCSILFSCGHDVKLLPKKRMYPFVDYPQRNYIQFDEDYCHFTFTYPDYLKIQKDSFYFEGKPKDECWFNLSNTTLNNSWYCSYYPIRDRKAYDELVNDAFTITDKHNKKAIARKESIIINKNGVTGILFEVDGPVASPVQFYLTDSTHHFFRASLYLNATVNPDSTAPVFKFLIDDMQKMIEDFNWKS